jgi:hypothetical protein
MKSERNTLATESNPSVVEVIKAMEVHRDEIASDLRRAALDLDGVDERTLYDHFCREWTPAFYVGRTQLFHIHNFRAGLRATMFVGVNTLQPIILSAERVSTETRQLVAETATRRFTKEFRMPLVSIEDGASFMDLVRVKWAFVQGGAAETPNKTTPAWMAGRDTVRLTNE